MTQRKSKPIAPLPTPASKEAIEQGCTCPRMDNNNGEGIMMDGHICFWMNDSCPLHGMKE